ncbi:Uncharacterised protein [uncultured Roseburia sp.]|uniref:IrrE N-terminal-like domain-containing protein n=1 Tax=Brotonthovivens ammoniilytica TaxID=2981725 RepID=A0ABT2TKB1_9FIRM|nr:hypothetical protein [Brotonthovivens ammoniilytica]MCU6762266.1 hypothetical protein [Brotonthovivens ammoniilytica]SCI60704.1 Uncharacterised protein [uncultured Roseburia sp.]
MISMEVITINYEKLLSEADDHCISVDENIPFQSNLKGLYISGNIALSNRLETTSERSCILAEELGHHYTSTGNILDQSVTENRKQEYRARLWAYNKLIGLTGIITAYEHCCRSFHEMADYLNVTEKFLLDTINCYKNKYGLYTIVDNYIIYFEPALSVGKLTSD